MEQANNVVQSLLTMTAQTQLPKPAKDDGGDSFQKLLDQKTQEKDTLLEQPAKTPAKTEAAPAKKTQKAPAKKPQQEQKQDDPMTQVKELLKQGAWVVQPDVPFTTPDGETLEAGTYVVSYLDGESQVIPTGDLEPEQMGQLQQLLDAQKPLDPRDDKADAMLEATDPAAEHGPAQLLEKATAERFGRQLKQTVKDAAPEDAQPRQEADGDDVKAELSSAAQSPQRVFHDVQAAPVKVGEAETVEDADEMDVIRQLDAQIIACAQRGEPTVTVKLNPEHLGEVTVQIAAKAGGAMAVSITARNEGTRALLERHAGQLQGMLAGRVSGSVEVEVQRGQESQQNQQHSYDGHSGHAQDGQQQRQPRRERDGGDSRDFLQQLRLGLIPADGEL